MDLDNLRDSIKDIIDLVSTLPEEYRLKTYEILLTHTIMGEEIALTVAQSPPPEVGHEEAFIVPIDVRAMFSQYDVDESFLKKLFLISGSEIRPIYKISTTTKAKAQIQVACLLALENALGGGKFAFALESLRQRLGELKAYDGKNFSTNLKNNSKLFKSLDEEEIELSPDGKAALADIILEIAK